MRGYVANGVDLAQCSVSFYNGIGCQLRQGGTRELHEMADEGLVLAARAKVRLGQSLCAAQHTEGHLQVAGGSE